MRMGTCDWMMPGLWANQNLRLLVTSLRSSRLSAFNSGPHARPTSTQVRDLPYISATNNFTEGALSLESRPNPRSKNRFSQILYLHNGDCRRYDLNSIRSVPLSQRAPCEPACFKWESGLGLGFPRAMGYFTVSRCGERGESMTDDSKMDRKADGCMVNTWVTLRVRSPHTEILPLATSAIR